MRTQPPQEKASTNLTSSGEFKELSEILRKIKKKYNLTTVEVINKVEKRVIIPLNIFTKQLSPLETVTKYLKENLNLTNKQISNLLNRSKKTIWQAYNSSLKKRPLPIKSKPSKFNIDTTALQNRKYTVLESIVLYLKQTLTYHEIAELLKRDDRTIWTVYHRAKEK